MKLLAIFLTLALTFAEETAWAQDQQGSADDQKAAAGEQSQPLLNAGQLDQLVAPIALYPDPLLAQVLMAATYPLEVVQADRFAKANKSLKGDALTARATANPAAQTVPVSAATIVPISAARAIGLGSPTWVKSSKD